MIIRIFIILLYRVSLIDSWEIINNKNRLGSNFGYDERLLQIEEKALREGAQNLVIFFSSSSTIYFLRLF